MKKSKKISVLISLVLILILALSAVSAADDVATDDVELASVDEVQTVDNTPTTDEIYTEPTDIVVTDTGDSGDLDDADSDVISDTGQEDDSDDGDEAVVSDASSPKNALKAVTDPDEPLGAPDGSFRDLYNLINNAQSGSTITLDRNYVYNPSTDSNYVNGITIAKNLVINGNGYTIDGQGVARGLILNGYTSSSWLIRTVYHGYTYTLNNINFVNLTTTAAAGAAIASHTYPNIVRISNCNFTNNRGNRGAVSVSVQNPDAALTDVDTGSVTITGCIFKENYASDRGGAIYSGISYDRTSITANNNVFINNTAAGYAQAVFYSNANYINVNYNWWGQNAWNNGFVANSATNYVTPTYRYQASFAPTGGKTLELTLALNSGTAPSGSTLPARNASFSIDSGIVDPESEMFQGSIEVTYASLEDTTITAIVDNQQFTLEVSKTPRENINELTITVADVVLPNQAQVIVNTDVRGTFNITIGDTVKEVNITNGQATITWDSLPAGQYFAVVSCVGDIRYNDKFAYTSFKVEKQNVTITVTATPDTIVYGDGETVTLSSALNDTAATAGTVTYYVDGTESGTTLDDLTVGTHEVIAKYTGDPIYNDAESAPITVTVSKPRPTISVTANPIMYGQDATITIGLHGLNDESITGLVKVTINGKIYDLAVINGVGALTVSGLAAREDGYPISVEFAGNENYNSANNYGTKQVVHKAQPIIGVTPVEISYGEDAVVTITLEHPNGEKLDGVVVIATVDGEDYPVTISNGVGTLTVRDLIVENYDIMVYFPGNDNYSSVETTRYDSIVVKKAVVDVSVGNVVVTRPATGTIVLTASAPGEYIVKVGDEEYEVNVDFAGVAVEIPILSMLAGSYDVKVTADETQNYEEVDVTFEDAYVVIKRNITVEATPNATEIAYGDNITLNHSISAPEGAVLTGDVSYYIDGEKVESVFTGSKVGTYTFTVSYTGDPDYNDAVSAPVTLTVNKLTPNFWVIPNNKTYGDRPSVGVFLFKEKTIFGGLPGITVLVTINNVTYAVETTDFIGGYILYLDGLDANEEGYPISAVSLETDEYASVSNNTEVLKIYKANARLTVDSDRTSIDFGETITLSHEITEGATGAVTYYLNGTAVPGNILSNLMPGNYTVTAKYEGNKNYKPADSVNTLDITVKKANPKLSVSANNTVIKYLDSIKLLRVFDTPASGEVVWYVNGTPQMSNIVEDLNPGTYTVTAKYIEDEFYYDADSLNSLTITVLKEDVEIAVRSNAYTIEYGDSINLNSIIEPTEAWDGEVIYIVDGRETSNPTVSGLDVGTHSVIAKYVENDYFNEAYSEAITINVNRVAPSIEVLSDPVTYPNDAIVNFIVKGNNNLALPGVGIRVTINGVGYYVETGSDGKAVLTVKGLNVGEHTIGTVTVANDNYGPATNNTEKIIVNKGDLTITAGTSASSVAYGDEISFTNTITAPEGAVVSGNVKYFVDGNEIAGDGISTLAIGDHTVVAEYSGDANFNAVNSTAVSFTVTKADPTLTISANATEIQYLDDIKLSYTITPDGATGSVVYYLDGTPVDGDVLRLLEPGNYTVTAKYEGNDYYNEADSSNSLKITVGKCDVSIEVNSNYYTIEYGQAILLSAAVDPFISTGHITYIVDGVEGDESYFTDLSVGTHSIAARFNENVYYNGALSEAKTITVTKATPTIDVMGSYGTYPDDAAIAVVVKDANGNYISGIMLNVTVNNIDYAVVTDDNGLGSLIIKGLDAGTYPISAVSLENGQYASATYSGDANIVVQKANAIVAMQNVIVTYPNVGVISLTSTVPGDYTVNVGGKNYAARIYSAGETATVTVDLLDAGKYPISVSADLGKNYEPLNISAFATYTVNNATIVVTAPDTVVAYPGKGDFLITTNAEGEYTIKVGDKTYTQTLFAGENRIYVEDELALGTYDVVVSATITNYNVVENQKVATYTVVPAEIEVSCENVTTYYPNRALFDLFASVDGDYVITIAESGYDVTVANGYALVYPHTWIPVGVHDVTVTADFGENYKPLDNVKIGTYTVLATEIELTVVPNATEIAYGEEISLDYNADMYIESQYVTYLVDGKEIEGNIARGLTVGTHTVAVKYSGDPNIEDIESAPVTITVNKASPVINVVGSENTYPANGTVSLTVANANGDYLPGITVKVTVNGVDYAVVTNDVGAATLTIKGLDAGEYPIDAVSVANDNYASVTYSGQEKIVVKKITPVVEIPNNVIVTYPDTGLMGIKASVPGTYTVKVGTEEIPVVITEADTIELFYITKVLDAGKYNVSVTADLGKNYEPVSTGTLATYTVNNGTIVVSAPDTVVAYPGKGDFLITTNAEGEYTIKVGDKTYTQTLFAGENRIYVEDEFALGTYDVVVSAAIPNYNVVENQKIATYTVEQAEVTVYCDNVTVYYPNYMIVTIFASVDGEYTITIANEEHAPVTVSNGKGYLYPHTWIPVGVHDVIANADLGENYKPVINQKIGTYTVLKADLEITVVPNATSIVYGDEISLDYRADMSIDENHLTYIVDGQDIEGNVASGLSVGTHTVAVKYTGDSGIEDVVSAPVSITVAKAVPEIEVRSIDTTYPNPAIVEVIVKNDAGAPLAGVTVRVSVNGVDYAVVTDSTGQAILTINGLNAGEYPIAAVSVANDNYEDGTYSGDAKVVVKKAVAAVSVDDVTVTYPNAGAVEITASVPGTYIIKVGTEEIPVVITAKDQPVTVPVTKVLNVGEYDISVTADLGDNYEPVDTGVIATYTVNKGDIGVRSNQSYWTVTYPEKGTILLITNTSGNFTLKVGDVSYPVELFAGENEFAVPDILNVGRHIVYISADIDNYNPLEDERLGSYMVEIGKINVTAQDVTVIFPDYHYITITASVTGWYYVKVGDEVWEVFVSEDGGTGITSTLKYGVGTYDVSVTADFGDNYEPVDTGVIAKYVVSPAEAGIVVTAEDYLITQTGELVIAVSSGVQGAIAGTATVEIDGAIYKDNVTVEDGSAVVKLENIGVGEHNVKVTFHSTDFKEIDNITTFTVSKSIPVVEVTGATVEYGDPATVKVKVTDEDGNPGTGTVIVVASWDADGETQVIELEADGTGEATFVLAGVAPGTVDLKASFIGNDKYESSYNDTEKIIIKDSTDLILEVTANEVDYGEDTIITIAAKDGSGAGIDLDQVNITIDDGEAQLLDVENGKVNLGKLAAGEHTIKVSVNDGVHEEATASTVAVVEPIAALIDASVKNYAFDETGKLIVNVTDLGGNPLSGGVAVEIDDELVDYEVTVTDGVAQLDLTGYAIGEHSVHVIFDNPNYRNVDVVTHFNVTKKTPVVSVTGTTVKYGTPATVKITVSDDGLPITNGTVIVTVNWVVDGQTVVVEIEEGAGEATFVLTDGAPGTFDITATYIANDYYNSAVNNTEKIIVTESTDLSLDVTANEVTYGGDTVLAITATDGSGAAVDLAKVNVTIDGVSKEYDVVDGKVNVGKLPAGVTEITVSVDDGFHDTAEDKVNATVSPAVPDLTVTPGESQITIDVKDGTQPISGIATVVIDGDSEHAITVTVDEDGNVVVPIDVAPGNHAVEVIFNNDNYTQARQTVAVNVPKVTPIVNVTGTTVEYGTPATVKVKVTDEDGNPIEGSVIVVASWEADGETQVVELDENGEGQATFTLAGLAQGTYADINATFIETDNYASAYNDTEKIHVTDSTELTLEVSANEVTVGEDTILTVTATDGSGATVDFAKVNVTIDGVTKEYDVTDGKVNLGPLPVGTTEITVSVDDDFYGHAQDTVNATVNKAAADVTVTAGNGTVNITAKDNETGEPISGTATVVIDGGEPQNVTIGEDGTIEYAIEAAPGPHTVEVTFTNDDYEPVTKTVTVIVPKHTTELSIATEDTPKYGDNVTVTATITEGAKGTITYYVDGSSVGTELAIGEDFVVSGLSAGEHTITAKYAGNENYSAADSNVLKFTVAKAELVIAIGNVQTYYPNTGTVEVSANNDGEYTINVNNKPYTVTIVNGKGRFNVTEVLPVAEYPITWDIAESENYTGASGSAVYEVLNTAPDFSITGSSEINYGQDNTIVPTINEDATGNITYMINGEDKGKLGLKENLTLEGLDAGHYTVNATYSGDVNYGSMSKIFEFDVLPIDVLVSVASDEVYYPNTGSVSLNVSAPGNYTVYVGNKSYEIEVAAPGVVDVPINDIFEVGKYDINVTAPATTNYNEVDTGAIGTYVVSKAKSIITVSYDNATGKATVTLESAEDHVKLNETISFELDGTSVPGLKTTDGVYVSEDLALAPGKHSIFVVFVGNDNYLGSYAQTAFEVDKFATAVVTVSADPIKEGEDAIIKIAVKDGDKGLSGVVTVTLDGTDYAVDVTDGEGTLTVKNLVANTTPTTEYPIIAKFNGNDEYAEATGEGSINVTDYNDVIIVISGGDENAAATLIDSDLNPINGKVNVTVDDNDPVELDVVDGKVIIPVDDIGDHDITVDYLGDETHKPASESATVFVGKKLIPTTMLLTVSDITYTENEQVVVILKDESGLSISGKVTLTIGDMVKEVTVTDGQGQTTISGLDAGTKTVIGEFVSDGTYAGTVVSTTFTVKQMKTRIVANNMTTTAINVSDDGRIGKWLTMTLVDANGKALANKKVSFGFNAKVYNRTTDANGKASLQINLQKAGDYTFAISFLGDKNYEGAFEVVKITVNKQKASMTASGATYKASAKTKTLSATLKDVAGNPMPEKKVTFTVNGKTYSAVTDSKGVAKVNVSLTKAGSYSVEVKFAGTSTYEALTRKVTLKLT